MSTINVPLPDEDLAFLRAYSEAQGISVEAFFARQARNLREQIQKPLADPVRAASDVISREIDGEKAHREYLEEKHG